jgi:hypothetical protein
MELLHHQATMREMDGQFVCSRCGLVNPSADQPCIPTNIEPAALKPAADRNGMPG